MSLKRDAALAALALLWLTFGPIGEAVAANPVANADELVARHLDSIASPAVRAGLKTRVVQGLVHFRIVVGGAGALDGKAFLVSDGKKFQFMMKLPNTEYDGEQFIFDGQKHWVGFSTGRQTRSAFGDFVLVQSAVIDQGLFGGVLSTAWPLLNLDEREAKVSFEGPKSFTH